MSPESSPCTLTSKLLDPHWLLGGGTFNPTFFEPKGKQAPYCLGPYC